MSPKKLRVPRGFTLIEILAVTLILAVLISIGSVVSQSMIKRSREQECTANLRSIHQATTLYANDYDGSLPFAKDWLALRPECAYFMVEPSQAPRVTDVLHPYLPALSWRCPLDRGVRKTGTGEPAECIASGDPNSLFERGGSSYGFAGKPSPDQKQTERPEAEKALAWDLAGVWHGTSEPEGRRFNTVFRDGHVQLLNQRGWTGAR